MKEGAKPGSPPSAELAGYLFGKNTAEGLRQILDCLPDGVVAIDNEARIFYTNQAYQRALGVPGANVLGRSMREIEPGAAILQVLESGQSLSKTVLIKSVNRYAKVSIFPLGAEGRVEGAVSFFRDVTKEYHMQQELRLAQNLAEHFKEQLDDSRLAGIHGMVGSAPEFLRAVSLAGHAAPTSAAVLLLGEHGVGKEVMARAIHLASRRREKPFIAVNCAALPENLLESELFGYEEGAFTGAKKGGRLGKFELAAGGTLFMDEIGDMSASMQAKLLRALQEKEIEKLGRSKVIIIDVRIIAATNRDLGELMKQGKFRADLFYRLNVVAISLPPLRARPGDVPLLCEHFLQKYRENYDKDLSLHPESRRIILAHNWPGNIRELQNCLEYAAIMCPSGQIMPRHLPNHLLGAREGGPVAPASPQSLDWHSALASLEVELLQKALNAHPGNRSEAIRQLGLSRRAFYRKLKQYSLH